MLHIKGDEYQKRCTSGIAIGTVLHNNTYIGDNVKIYQNVTFGRADIWKKADDSKFERFVVEEGAVICAGAKIIGKEGTLTIGRNSVIAANAILLNSTGENEVCVGGYQLIDRLER